MFLQTSLLGSKVPVVTGVGLQVGEPNKTVRLHGFKKSGSISGADTRSDTRQILGGFSVGLVGLEIAGVALACF